MTDTTHAAFSPVWKKKTWPRQSPGQATQKRGLALRPSVEGISKAAALGMHQPWLWLPLLLP